MPDLVRIVVAIDPATTSGEDADETGIIVAGKDGGGRGYVLADRSGHYTPTEWAQLAIALAMGHEGRSPPPRLSVRCRLERRPSPEARQRARRAVRIVREPRLMTDWSSVLAGANPLRKG